jgi:hypothetical protein
LLQYPTTTRWPKRGRDKRRKNESVKESGKENVNESAKENENVKESGSVNEKEKKRDKKREKEMRDKSVKRNERRKKNVKGGDTLLDPPYIHIRGRRPTGDRQNRISSPNLTPRNPCPAICPRYHSILGCKCPPTCWTDRAWECTRRYTRTAMVLSILSETSCVEWTRCERVNRSF